MEGHKISKNLILGVSITSLKLNSASKVIAKLIDKKGKKTIFYVDANHFNIAENDPEYKEILANSSFVHASGMGPILASKILGVPLPGRAPTPNFIEEFFLIAQKKNWTFYLLGGDSEVVSKTVINLNRKFPKLKIVGYHHGFFKNDSKIIKEINKLKPDIVLVGMGPPRQEKWIEKNKDKINANVFWAVGALFDILSGYKKRAPKWMQDIGLEWIFRVGQEPRRLWKRYLFGNIHFFFHCFSRENIIFS